MAAERAPVTSLRTIHKLSNDQASQGLPVAFEATVTYFRSYEKTLFVQDRGNAEVREASQDEYVLDSDGRLFSAIYRHPDPASGLPFFPMKRVPVGSRVRVAGICLLEDANPIRAQSYSDGGFQPRYAPVAGSESSSGQALQVQRG